MRCNKSAISGALPLGTRLLAVIAGKVDGGAAALVNCTTAGCSPSAVLCLTDTAILDVVALSGVIVIDSESSTRSLPVPSAANLPVSGLAVAPSASSSGLSNATISSTLALTLTGSSKDGLACNSAANLAGSP